VNQLSINRRKILKDNVNIYSQKDAHIIEMSVTDFDDFVGNPTGWELIYTCNLMR
jgi:hypothetical protein